MNERPCCNDRCYGEPCIHIQPGYRPATPGLLPYGWWKSALFWDIVLLLLTGAVLALIMMAWIFDWKPMW